MSNAFFEFRNKEFANAFGHPKGQHVAVFFEGRTNERLFARSGCDLFGFDNLATLAEKRKLSPRSLQLWFHTKFGKVRGVRFVFAFVARPQSHHPTICCP